MAHFAIYGNTSLKRQYCNRCRRYAFVIDGDLQCCNEFVGEKEPVKVKRMSGPLQKRNTPKKIEKETILNGQDNCCIYCGQEFGDLVMVGRKIVSLNVRWDHLDPYSYSQNNNLHNFVASCQICNGWKSDKMFNNIQEIKQYVRNRWAFQ